MLWRVALISDIADENENDGGWSKWGHFSDCGLSPEGDCKRTRERQCDSPLPSERGLPCVGSDSETESCDIESCTGRCFFIWGKPSKCYYENFHNSPSISFKYFITLYFNCMAALVI